MMGRVIALCLMLASLAVWAPSPLRAQAPAEETTADTAQDSFSREMARMMLDLFDRALVEMRKNMLGETAPDARGKCDCQCPQEGKEI
jgi:hypothetical protein